MLNYTLHINNLFNFPAIRLWCVLCWFAQLKPQRRLVRKRELIFVFPIFVYYVLWYVFLLPQYWFLTVAHCGRFALCHDMELHHHDGLSTSKYEHSSRLIRSFRTTSHEESTGNSRSLLRLSIYTFFCAEHDDIYKLYYTFCDVFFFGYSCYLVVTKITTIH